MSTRFEYVNVKTASLELTDERNLAVDDPDPQVVLIIGYDEAVILTGTREELIAFAMCLYVTAIGTPTPYEDNDLQQCTLCDDEVYYLTSAGLCDGCVEMGAKHASEQGHHGQGGHHSQ